MNTERIELKTTDDEFRRFTKCCAAILSRNGSKPGIVAIDCLNLISQYPTFFERYKILYGSPISPFGWFSRYAKNLFRCVGELGLSLVYGNTLPKNGAGSDKNVDVLVISHLLRDGDLLQINDFYFGDLSCDLNENGINAEIRLIDHRKPWTSLRSRPREYVSSGSRASIPRLLKFPQEARILFEAFKSSLKLVLKSFAYAKQDLCRRVALSAATEAFSPGTIAALRLSAYVSRYCRDNPSLKAVFVTWEGHSWERMVFKAAREVRNNITCIGYQHSAILKHSHALFRSLGAQYDPSVILTSGSVSREIFIRAMDFRNIPVVVYGSNKASAISSAVAFSKKDVLKCLVLPQGEMVECIQMAEFIRAAAAAIPNVIFQLRFHPIVDREMIVRRCPFLIDSQPNILLSTGVSLEDDLIQSTWALYRGTATSIQAVLSGVRPIYFDAPGSTNIDSLYDLHVWKKAASSVKELATIFEDDIRSSEIELSASWRSGHSYCRDYFSYPNSTDVLACLGRD